MIHPNIIARLEAAIGVLHELMITQTLSDAQRKHAGNAIIAISDALAAPDAAEFTIPRYLILPKRLRTQGVY